MNIIFKRNFYKDIRKVKDKKTLESIEKYIIQFRSSDTVEDISNVKKLKSEINAYRIRIGNYRLGFYIEYDTVIVSRFLKREDIYKFFP